MRHALGGRIREDRLLALVSSQLPVRGTCGERGSLGRSDCRHTLTIRPSLRSCLSFLLKPIIEAKFPKSISRVFDGLLRYTARWHHIDLNIELEPRASGIAG